jgi:leader peptidase (prepilin peptidase)/N-methyltransferase
MLFEITSDRLVVTGIGLLAGVAATYAVVLPLARAVPENLLRSWRSEYGEGHPALSTYEGAVSPITLATRLRMMAIGGVLTAMVVGLRGINTDAIAWSAYFLGLVLLVSINLRITLLPDAVCLFLLWAGLIYQTWQGHAVDSVYGAALGYALPYSLSFAVRMSTGKTFIGNGDLKTFSMAGAWFGTGALPTLFPFFFGLVILAALLALNRKPDRTTMPTGVAHLLASAGCFVLGAVTA